MRDPPGKTPRERGAATHHRRAHVGMPRQFLHRADIVQSLPHSGHGTLQPRPHSNPISTRLPAKSSFTPSTPHGLLTPTNIA